MSAPRPYDIETRGAFVLLHVVTGATADVSVGYGSAWVASRPVIQERWTNHEAVVGVAPFGTGAEVTLGGGSRTPETLVVQESVDAVLWAVDSCKWGQHRAAARAAGTGGRP